MRKRTKRAETAVLIALATLLLRASAAGVTAVLSTLARSSARRSPTSSLDPYTIVPADLNEAEAEVRRREQTWRQSGAVAVTESDVDRALRRAKELQGEIDQAKARSRLSLRLGYLYIVRFFVLTNLPRHGKGSVIGAAAAVLCALSLLLSPFLFSTLARALSGALVLMAASSALAVAAVFSLWPTERNRELFQRLQRERKCGQEQVAALRQPVARAWEEYEAVRRNWMLLDRLGEARRRRQELADLLASAKYQLIHTNWRDLRGGDFERFLSRVFVMLGYHVELTKASGDQGVDLILTGKGRRIAVQTKGYADSVGNHSVMEAVAGMAFYRCTACAVVTNSRFTRTAEQLAAVNHCQLIAGIHIPDLIEGRIY